MIVPTDKPREVIPVVARRRLKLTPRWTVLKPHRLQAAYVHHRARFKINPSGRRSGKTELLKRKSVLKLLPRKGRPWPQMIALGAPSFGQARDIFWDDLKAMVPETWLADKPSETRLEIRTRWGSLLRVFGFDRPRRIEGVPWDFFGLDEIADCPKNCFKLNIRPALATLGREGGADLVGVPDEVGRNQAEYEELYNAGLQWPHKDPDLCAFHWASADILDAKEIKALQGGLDDFSFQQEMGGKFVSSQGKAFPRFDVQVHVDNDGGQAGYWSAHDPRLPIDWAMDFGVTPAVSLICQAYGRHVWVMDEIVCNDGSTELQVEEFAARVAARGYATHRIRLFADAAGKSRHSPTGESDFDVIEDMTRGWPIEMLQANANPAIKDTVNAVRATLATAEGEVRLHIHPRCQMLIDNLRTAPWPDKLNEFHALAALRYYCYGLFGDPVGTYQATPLLLPNLGGSARGRARGRR